MLFYIAATGPQRQVQLVERPMHDGPAPLNVVDLTKEALRIALDRELESCGRRCRGGSRTQVEMKTAAQPGFESCRVPIVPHLKRKRGEQ